MDTGNNIRLLYELNAQDARLDLAIRQAEGQLAAVNGKLQSLWYDFALYAAMAILPELIYQLCSRVHVFRFGLLHVFCLTFRCVYLLALPFVIYHLGRAVYLLRLNREDTADYTEPVRSGTPRYEQLPREPSYRAEHKKLVYILSRYYLNKDTLGQIRRQITEADSCAMTLAQLRYELNSLPFYEEVRPALPFEGRTGGNMALPLVISFIIGLLYVFRVWGII